MSDKSWKAEFYPESARAIVRRRASDADLLRHAIRKWSGWRDAALRKHGIVCPPIEFDSSNCGLCLRYYTKKSGCSRCPANSCYPAWQAWVNRSVIGPMLRHLRKALRRVVKEEGH